MPVSESKRAGNDRYNATCDYISIRPKKAAGAEIRAAAAGQSLQGYILQACRERMEREQGEKRMEVSAMTDMQFKKIFEMFDMILDGCKDLEEARRKVKQLRGEKDEKKQEEEK